MDKLYRIGFDIGIGSVGWAVLENDPVTEEPSRILKLGVRTFSPNEVAKTGESTAKARREKRGLHRRTRRKAFRIERLKNLLKSTFNFDIDEELKLLSNIDVYELRARALDSKVSNGEIAKIILNIAKRRGFQSNRKSGAMGDDGVLLSAIRDNSKFLQEKGYRTIGEALFKDERFKIESCGKFIYNIRNHGGDYRNCFHRDDLKNELEIILKNQQYFGNSQISNEFIKKVVNIFSKQRNFDEGPGEPSPYSAKFEIGKCTFLGGEGELRAPKATFTFEYFNALSKINSLRINDKDLSLEQKEILRDYILKNKELKFERVRKLLNIAETETFNLCRYTAKKKNRDEDVNEANIIAESEKTTFVSLKHSYEICKEFGIGLSIENKDVINEIATLFTLCKSDKKIEEFVSESEILSTLSDEQKKIIFTTKLNFDKVGSLSIKAMERIIPYLENGDRYDVACKNAGFNHSSFEHDKLKLLKGEKIDERLEDITSNVVKRAVNQTLRILNEIIKEYGSPQFVTVELSRELSKDFGERNKIKKIQEHNFIDNENAKNDLAEKFNLQKVSHFDLIKYRLYEEQNGKCMYSGKDIDVNRLYEPNYVQVDHVIPYSRSMNDSYNNKVLVLSSENQNKRNQTPYEWFGKDEQKWNGFVSRVNLLRNREKKRFLLKENFSEEQSKDFIERNLNDTKYMAKFMLNLMQDYLEMRPSTKHKKVVRSVNGAVTSYLRRCWGINKIREDGDIHHCIDAAIIATATAGQIQKITKYSQLKEKFIRHDDDKYISKLTGEVMTAEQKKEFEQEGVDLLSKHLPTPYNEFIEELKIRSRTNYKELEFTNDEKLQLAKLGYESEEIDSAKPVFVSRMKTVKTTGAIHQETMMSVREYDETKNLIKSVKISSLKLDNTCEEIPLKDDKYPEFSIKNYYKPESDRLLYLKIKEYLKENGSIPENKPFYKPRKDGTDGPIVKTVKVYEKASNCVITPNGAAANDKMFRVDVFEKDGKYYLCPIYKADVYAKRLPDKLVVAGGKEWLILDDSYNFKFSLYQNDLIEVENKKDITLKKCFKDERSTKPNEINSKKWLVYYGGLDVSTGALVIKNHDNCYDSRLGAKTLLEIKKYYVDIMGKIYKAPKEERKGF
ncbi:MAG: type II CRISPR RNA-guided endonuclease Cas9 [Clostridia bacterium]|nr:type II CRISPR RNA-guided endonuclease Cas9 [Clostridia bacterium]